MAKMAHKPEPSVTTEILALLSSWATFRTNAPSSDGEGYLDIWCQPSLKLCSAGWPHASFGIEIKGYELEDHRKRTAIHLVYQAIRYSQMRFTAPWQFEPEYPEILLIYPRLSILLGDDPYKPGLCYGLCRLAALFDIGELQLTDDNFTIYFNDEVYFDARRGYLNRTRRRTSRPAPSI